jgi:hypothetical protein
VNVDRTTAPLAALGLSPVAIETLVARGMTVQEDGSGLAGLELARGNARVRFGATWARSGRAASVATARFDGVDAALVGRVEGIDDALVYADRAGRLFADVDLVEPFCWADDPRTLLTRWALDLRVREPFEAQPAALWGAGAGDDVAQALRLARIPDASDGAERRWSDGAWVLAELRGPRPSPATLQLWHATDASLRGWTTDVPDEITALCARCNRAGRAFRPVGAGLHASGDVGTIRP